MNCPNGDRAIPDFGITCDERDVAGHRDPWCNPAVERQATDHAHRIGQTQHVFVYKLIAARTIEEKIVDLQARMAELASAIFSGKRGWKRVPFPVVLAGDTA